MTTADGGITVSKTTTGSLLLQDIQVAVHHQIPTYIPADKALNSKDLHRALGNGSIFQLNSTMFPTPKKPQEDPKMPFLEEENRLLKAALAQSTQQGNALQGSVDALGRQVQALAEALGRLAVSGPVVAGSAAPLQAQSEVVGGDVPMFIPDMAPTETDVKIQVQETVSESDSVSAAADKLRKLRRQQGG